jgi:TonB-dependent starch-binding outer membrane protein SusC
MVENVRILGNFYGEGQLMEGLVVRTSLGYNYNQHNGRTLSFANPEHSEPQTLDALSQTSNESFQWNWSNTLNYATTIADIHRVNVIVGTEAIESNYEEMNASRSQYFSTNINYMRLNSGEINQLNNGYGSEWSLFSVFGRANYDLSGKYFLEATVRRDGSSRFGPTNRYGTFPAASVAWAVSQEDFMAGTRNWLDFMKFRLGWGITGNDRIGNYDVYTTYNTHPNLSHADMTGSNTSVMTGFRPNQFGNPNVSWETTQMVNLGLDLTLFQNKVNFGIDIYEKNTTDMLYQIEDPVVAGFPATRPYVNIGEMKNTGFDLELGYNNTAANGQFRYGASMTISHYKNEIMKLSGNPDERIPAGSLRQMNYSSFEVGTSYPQFYGYVVDGIFQTQAEADAHPKAFGATGTYNQAGRFIYRDVNEDGVINASDMDYIGNPHPDFTGGLNLNLGYGNFDLSMFFYGSYGNDMINYVRRWIDYTQFLGNRSHDRLYNSWGSPYLANNADAKLPIADLDAGSQQPSTHFVEDGSFLRMKSLRLSYTVPQTFLNRYGVQGVSIYGQGTNLFTLTNYSGLDPELHQSGRFMGLDQGAWPTARQFMFGISLTL